MSARARARQLPGSKPIVLTAMRLTAGHVRATVRSVSQLIRLMLTIAIVVQASPMRACAWEELATGSDCHERDGSDAGHGSSTPDHHCVCESPGPSMRQAPDPLQGDHLSGVSGAASAYWDLQPFLSYRPVPIGRASSDPPDSGHTVPMLN
jgi:hypothetical protein